MELASHHERIYYAILWISNYLICYKFIRIKIKKISVWSHNDLQFIFIYIPSCFTSFTAK